MATNITPFRSNSRDDSTSRSDRTKPQGSPRNEGFRKVMSDDKRPTKDEQELAAVGEEREESPSLFDLSKTSKPKNKSTLGGKSTLKDSGSEVTQRPVTAKQNQDHGEESDQDSFNQTTSSTDKNQMASSDKPVKLLSPDEEFYTNAETEAQPSQETPEKPLLGQESSKTQTTQPQTPIKNQMKKTMEQAATPQPLDALKQAQVASSIQHPQKVKGAKEGESLFESDKTGGLSKKQKSSKSEETGSKSGANEARGEAIGAVNSSIQSADFHVEKAPENQEINRSATIRELAAQIVDRIQTMRKGDETQTVITLRNPPVLEGATITLTASDHAKREFNISFANLTPEAKHLLDRKLREDPLTDTLERKGIIVHMLTTSTQAEQTFTVDAGQASRDRQDQQQDQQEQQQRRQKFQPSDDDEMT